MTDELKPPAPLKEEIEVTDSPKNWKDYTTDPGFVAVLGFVTLLIGMLIVVMKPEIKEIYMAFSIGVVGLVGGHAFSDSQKTKFMCAKKEDP